MGEYRWINSHVIGAPERVVKLGMSNSLHRRLLSKLANKPLYVSDRDIIDSKTRFVDFFADEMLLMDNNLRVYTLQTVGSASSIYCYRMEALKCKTCRKKITYIDGMKVCEKCGEVKGEFI